MKKYFINRRFKKLEKNIAKKADFEEVCFDMSDKKKFESKTQEWFNEEEIGNEKRIKNKKFLNKGIYFYFDLFKNQQPSPIFVKIQYRDSNVSLEGEATKFLTTPGNVRLIFENIIFNGHTQFISSVQKISLTFKNCIFKSVSDFGYVDSNNQDSKSSFKALRFENCKFLDSVNFNEIDLTGKEKPLTFKSCAFLRGKTTCCLNFNSIACSHADFFDCFFNADSEMDKSYFEKELSFRECVFNGFFYRKYFGNLTKAHNQITGNSNDIDLIFRNSKFLKNVTKKERMADLFHKLKEYFLEKNDLIQAYQFYVLEEKAKNREHWSLAKGKGFWAILEHGFSWSTLYSLFSNYGSSLIRPIISLVVVTLLTSVLLYSLEEVYFVENNRPRYYEYILISLQGILRPFHVAKSMKIEGWSILIIILCNILVSVFVVLFVIALRRKFKV